MDNSYIKLEEANRIYLNPTIDLIDQLVDAELLDAELLDAELLDAELLDA